MTKPSEQLAEYRASWRVRVPTERMDGPARRTSQRKGIDRSAKQVGIAPPKFACVTAWQRFRYRNIVAKGRSSNLLPSVGITAISELKAYVRVFFEPQMLSVCSLELDTKETSMSTRYA